MIPRYLAGIVSIVVTHLLLAAGFTGIGLTVRRAFGLRPRNVDDLLMAFWIGFGCVIPFLILWNFFLPVNGVTLTTVLLAGGASIFAARHDLFRILDGRGVRRRYGVWTLLILAALWIANLSLGPLTNFDSGLYHIQGVLWAKHFAVVPGLGNLHGPLALNNSSLLFDALLDSGFWSSRGNHLANGLLVLMVLVQVIVAGARFTRGRSEKPASDLFVFALLAPVLHVGQHGRISSFVTDLPVSMLLLVVTSRLYTLLAAPDAEPEEEAFGVISLAILLATVVTLKMNSGVFAASCLVVSLAVWLRRRRGASQPVARTVAWALVIPTVVGLAWMGRGVFLSGYPLFPSTVAAAPVDWRVPPEQAAAEFAYIVYSARASLRDTAVVSGESSFLGWLPNWTGEPLEDPFYVLVPLALTAIAATVYFAGRRRATRPDSSTPWLMVLPIGIAVIAWFIGAPASRYIAPLFWSLAALTWTQSCIVWGVLGDTRLKRVAITAGLCLGLAPLVVNPILYGAQDRFKGGALRRILKYNLNKPGTDLWFQPVAEQPAIRTYTTSSGLVLNVPESRTGQCWDAPLPCTPNPAPNLQLREPGHLESGFRVDGQWQMESWPNPRQLQFLPAWRKSRR